MTNYFVDLGFDWNATQLTDASGNPVSQAGIPVYELQWGLVDMSTSPVSLASMTNFQDGDTVSFNIYDVTTLNGNRSSSASGAVPSITNSWMSCVPGDTGTPAGAGFSNLSAMNAANLIAEPPGTSAYFGAPEGPVWFINAIGNVTYPSSITSDASYRLVWTILAALPGQTKMFRIDPEMIVKPTG